VTVTGRHAVVTITPTYTGCPALQVIRRELRRRLTDAGFDDVEVRTSLSPAWTSDWITEEGRQKLGAAGIVPPHAAPVRSAWRSPAHPHAIGTNGAPALGAHRPTQRGSPYSVRQACRALYRCTSCGEPFEYLKEI
jgi:ring-1,2-phenylacetyl-CoA epoxidase subunit PaaD